MIVYCIDLDGTAFKNPKEVRKLYEHRTSFILLFTARSEKVREQTIKKLQKLNIPYHALVMGKPRADVYIDDRNAGGLQWPK